MPVLPFRRPNRLFRTLRTLFQFARLHRRERQIDAVRNAMYDPKQFRREK